MVEENNILLEERIEDIKEIVNKLWDNMKASSEEDER